MRTLIFALSCAMFVGSTYRVNSEEAPDTTSPLCVNIYHDETANPQPPEAAGPANAIMLANLLGHWPQYELRVRPIWDFAVDDLRACKSTIYLGTDSGSEVPQAFLDEFFETELSVAWVGFGADKLDAAKFDKTFGHRVSGQVSIDDPDEEDAAFYQYVSYKGSLFKKSIDVSSSKPEGAFGALRLLPTRENSRDNVVADLIHNKSYLSTPYFLRSGSKFVVGDVPFSYMHEGDRYFAFADLLFDILGEQPYRKDHYAFARTEDIHANYELPLVKAAISTLQSEGVPVSIAHIPMFMDPANAFGSGKVDEPQPATDVKEFVALMDSLRAQPRNTIIWHGVTHQYGLGKNPYSGTSGDDYEFWNMVDNTPVKGSSVQATLDRLASALPVFEAYKHEPRFWVTPHYLASAQDARVFAEVFPWQIGRITYFSSSFGPSFTIPAATRDASSAMPSVTKARLAELASRPLSDLDVRSKDPLTQMFPFEIYRDVYGQRIIPETLNYMAYATSDQTEFVRTADDILADARRNKVVRDYWASFFYHPYIFSVRSNGGIGRYEGDTLELRKLLIGLKLLGYQFVGLEEFESGLSKAAGDTAELVTKPAN